MILRAVISIITLLACITSCDISNRENGKTTSHNSKFIGSKNATLDSILKRKKLRAVTDYGSLSYLIYRGEPIGYQYELLKDLTKYLDVELDLVIENSLQKSIEMLNSGEVDLLAMGLTVTSERNKEFSFTSPIMTTRQVLVQRKPEGYLKMRTADEIESHLLRNTLDLAHVKINVQKGTIFEKRLETLSDELADSNFIITCDRDMEELIKSLKN